VNKDQYWSVLVNTAPREKESLSEGPTDGWTDTPSCLALLKTNFVSLLTVDTVIQVLKKRAFESNEIVNSSVESEELNAPKQGRK